MSRGQAGAVEDSVLAVAAFAVGAAGNLVKGMPQFVRTAVRCRVAGLAPGAVWLAALANVLWLCFGLAIHDVRFSVFSGIGMLLTGATLLRFVQRTEFGVHRRWGPACAAAAAGCAVLALLGADRSLAVLGVLLGVVISLPQLLHLWRVRGVRTDVSGVSQLEVLVVVTAQVGWTTYWLTQGQLVVAIGAAYGLVTRGVTLWLLRRQGDAPEADQAFVG